ncbi:MAG: Mrp/NBP35 family ATP-binding protein [Acidobacteria bacterium]|nr:Mrp/NBP35 family ATP-binding protein [Acidobacteriota bacterium]
MERLASVRDPELGATITELGMVGDVRVEGGVAHVEIALTIASCPLRSHIERDVREAVLVVEGIDDVILSIGVLDPAAKAALMRTARALAQARAPQTSIPRRAPVVMIASGKGGVGKSSITANLAIALASTGRRVGVLDADIWGFSLARLLDITGEVEVRGAKMVPLERPYGRGSVSLLSMGHLADEKQALLWRGLVVQKAVAQFIEDADWSGIDVMVIDTPPGTGDIVMTLARLLPHMGVVVVTTPSRAAQHVAARAADFANKSHIRLLGVIENMSGFACECGKVHAPLGVGGGRELAHELGAELLAQIPLRDDVADGGDEGVPVALHEGDDGYFHVLAQRLWTLAQDLVPAGCTARLLDAIEYAVDQPSSS